MLSRLFPKQFDNAYRGYAWAIWLLVPLLLVKLGQGAVSLADPSFVIKDADGIPLDTFDAGGAATVVFMFTA